MTNEQAQVRPNILLKGPGYGPRRLDAALPTPLFQQASQSRVVMNPSMATKTFHSELHGAAISKSCIGSINSTL